MNEQIQQRAFALVTAPMEGHYMGLVDEYTHDHVTLLDPIVIAVRPTRDGTAETMMLDPIFRANKLTVHGQFVIYHEKDFPADLRAQLNKAYQAFTVQRRSGIVLTPGGKPL